MKIDDTKLLFLTYKNMCYSSSQQHLYFVSILLLLNLNNLDGHIMSMSHRLTFAQGNTIKHIVNQPVDQCHWCNVAIFEKMTAHFTCPNGYE